jgi:hypothetical protein
MNGNIEIGFSQRIQLDWLERTANHQLAGLTRAQIQRALSDFLRDRLSVGGTAVRGNREKAITILLKIWVTVPSALEPLRDEGLTLLSRLPERAHLPLHWGMTLATYPFFGATATVVGRLLALQDHAPASQVQRRMREQLGERETVARAARRILRCMIDWGVLQESEVKGVYQASAPHSVTDKQVQSWLLEATLRGSQVASMPLKALTQSPALFPFVMTPLSMHELVGNKRLEYFRHGLDEEMVSVRGNGVVKSSDTGFATQQHRSDRG